MDCSCERVSLSTLFQDLLSQPRKSASDIAARAIRNPGSRTDRRGLLAILGVVSLLALMAASRIRPWVASLKPRSISDALMLRSALGILPVLPLSLLCGSIVTLDFVPEALQPITRFIAIAPPLAIGFLCVGATLCGSERSSRVSLALGER